MRDLSKSLFSLAMDMSIFMARGVSRTLSGDGQAFLRDSQTIMKQTADATRNQLGPELGQVSMMGREVQERLVDAGMGALGSNELAGASRVLKLTEDTFRRMISMFPMGSGSGDGSFSPARFLHLGEQAARDAGGRMMGENAASGSSMPGNPTELLRLMKEMLDQSSRMLSGEGQNIFDRMPMDQERFGSILDSFIGQWGMSENAGKLPKDASGFQNWFTGFWQKIDPSGTSGDANPVAFLEMFQQVMDQTLGAAGESIRKSRGPTDVVQMFNPLFWMEMGSKTMQNSTMNTGKTHHGNKRSES